MAEDSRKLRLEKKEKPVYNPTANYEWQADSVMPILGAEVERINKALVVAANTPEFAKFLSLYEGLAAMQNFFKNAVEEGFITEKQEEKVKDNSTIAKEAMGPNKPLTGVDSE